MSRLPTGFALLLALVFAAGLASCSKSAKAPSPTNADVVGVYLGRYFDGNETVEMRADGTFKQTFTKNGVTVYSHEGKWEFTPPYDVALKPFMSVIDYTRKNVFDGPPRQVGVMSADFRRDPDRIEFGEWPYLVTKPK